MIPVKICLDKLIVYAPFDLSEELQQLLADEVNVVEVEMRRAREVSVALVATQGEVALRRTRERLEHRAAMEARKLAGLSQRGWCT